MMSNSESRKRLDENTARPESGEDYGPGCDCTELCSMGPTCPGGMLAGLTGSGCWRQNALELAVTEDRTHGNNHAPLRQGVLLDPGFCDDCDTIRAALAEIEGA